MNGGEQLFQVLEHDARCACPGRPHEVFRGTKAQVDDQYGTDWSQIPGTADYSYEVQPVNPSDEVRTEPLPC